MKKDHDFKNVPSNISSKFNHQTRIIGSSLLSLSKPFWEALVALAI